MPPDVPPPTTRLLRRARRSPRAGFAGLHARMADVVWLWASLHLLPPLRRRLPPEDFVQEVWARAYAAFPAYDAGRADFRGWLFGIARNVLREQLRALRTCGACEAALDPAAEPVDPRTTVGTRAARSEAHERLLRRLERLPDADRKLAIWRGLEGLPFAEVGRRLGTSAVAADSRWRRLQGLLRGEFPDLTAGR